MFLDLCSWICRLNVYMLLVYHAEYAFCSAVFGASAKRHLGYRELITSPAF